MGTSPTPRPAGDPLFLLSQRMFALAQENRPLPTQVGAFFDAHAKAFTALQAFEEARAATVDTVGNIGASFKNVVDGDSKVPLMERLAKAAESIGSGAIGTAKLSRLALAFYEERMAVGPAFRDALRSLDLEELPADFPSTNGKLVEDMSFEEVIDMITSNVTDVLGQLGLDARFGLKATPFARGKKAPKA